MHIQSTLEIILEIGMKRHVALIWISMHIFMCRHFFYYALDRDFACY